MKRLNMLRLLGALVRHPRRAAHGAAALLLHPDPTLRRQALWWRGRLPRRSLVELFPEATDLSIHLERPFDREDRTSISRDELICLVAIARATNARRILEIGTFNGNTAMNLAANTQADVVTIDLPPDFDVRTRSVSLPVTSLNVTDRREIGRQARSASAGKRIRQVYDDSASLDWDTLGGPFDLIFIDGCHEAVYVENDSRRALAHLAPDGVLVWHDYAMIDDVTRVVDGFAQANAHLHSAAIEGTRLAVASARGFAGGLPPAR